MDINILDELTKKLQEGKQREMGLSDRLNYLDNYNKDVAVPQISSEGPKGTNPINSLNALFQMISNRKAISQDVSNQSGMNFDLLKTISSEQEKSKVDPYESLLKELKLKQAEADLEKTNKDLGREYDSKTGAYVQNRQLSDEGQRAFDITDELLGRNIAAVTRVPNIIGALSGENATTKAKVEQLKSLLALDARKLLKGSGAISDKETEMLKDSQTALRYSMSEEEFRKELKKVQDVLMGRYSNEKQSTDQSTLTKEDDDLINKYKNAGK